MLVVVLVIVGMALMLAVRTSTTQQEEMYHTVLFGHYQSETQPVGSVS